jgi:alpha-amylase
VAAAFEPSMSLDIPDFMSWADEDRDLTAWLGNGMQTDAIQTLYKMEPQVYRRNNPQLMDTWRMLQTSDHFYYMCTKWFADGDVHQYFNPYPSPYDAYINYMNILDDFSRQLHKKPSSDKGCNP